MTSLPAPVLEALEKPGVRGLLGAAWKKFSADRVSRIGAALAYYAVFALAPLILVAVGIAGLFLSEDAARGEIVDRLADTVGRESALFVESMVARAGGGAGVGGAIVGLVLSFVAASAVATQLKGGLDTVWDVPAEDRMGIIAALQSRAKGLAVVLGAGAILLAVMATSAAIAGIEEIAGSRQVALVFDIVDPLIGITFGAAAFTFMFRFLPARHVAWSEAAVGGGATAVLFTIATLGLSRYLGSGTVGEGFGAAAALVVLLVFVYYSAQIVLFGAEIARVWGIRRRRSGTERPSETEDVAAAPPPESIDAPRWAVAAFVIGVLIGSRRS